MVSNHVYWSSDHKNSPIKFLGKKIIYKKSKNVLNYMYFTIYFNFLYLYSKVKVLFKFTRAGGNRSEEDTRGLLRVVGAEEDKQLLKFWREGLSSQYKKHMFTSNFNPPGK